MNLWSIAFSYRLGLGFHALNNEGADGSNLMQPRRIDVGTTTYDGISGEIIRHHVLENFVHKCSESDISVLPMSAALHPDRGPIGIRAAAKASGVTGRLGNDNLFPSVREAIKRCAVLDVGGYLAAWKEQAEGSQKKEYRAEKQYIDSECVAYGDAEPVKRESCFDVAWLISEQPQDSTITQHSAYRDTFDMNSRYAQTMRSNVYGGVIRADLHRIGTDDYWYLQPGEKGGRADRLVISVDAQIKRQVALVRAVGNFIASPTGAKVAGWAPHVFLIEGAILLSSSRTAPFLSPIAVRMQASGNRIEPNEKFPSGMAALNNDRDTWVKVFADSTQLLDSVEQIVKILESRSGKESQTK